MEISDIITWTIVILLTLLGIYVIKKSLGVSSGLLDAQDAKSSRRHLDIIRDIT